MSDLNDKINNFNNTDDFTNDYDSRDINENKVIAMFSYLSLLVLIPIFGAKESGYARFHANQGLVLMLAEIISVTACEILSNILFFGWIFGIVEGLAGLACFVFSVIGIINALSGRAKELPIVGKIRILK